MFLDNVMQVVKAIAKADRGLAVDEEMNLVSLDNLTEEEVNAPSFSSFAIPNLKESIEKGEAIISNNVIADLSDAPTTNTNFANLRMIVTLPIAEYGAIYIDQSVRRGVIKKETVAQLMELVQYLLDNKMEQATADEMYAVYEEYIT